jgi:hypothetical protein
MDNWQLWMRRLAARLLSRMHNLQLSIVNFLGFAITSEE